MFETDPGEILLCSQSDTEALQREEKHTQASAGILLEMWKSWSQGRNSSHNGHTLIFKSVSHQIMTRPLPVPLCQWSAKENQCHRCCLPTQFTSQKMETPSCAVVWAFQGDETRLQNLSAERDIGCHCYSNVNNTVRELERRLVEIFGCLVGWDSQMQNPALFKGGTYYFNIYTDIYLYHVRFIFRNQ